GFEVDAHGGIFASGGCARSRVVRFHCPGDVAAGTGWAPGAHRQVPIPISRRDVGIQYSAIIRHRRISFIGLWELSEKLRYRARSTFGDPARLRLSGWNLKRPAYSTTTNTYLSIALLWGMRAEAIFF